MTDIVERYEDMSPTGKLKLVQQTDGDMIIVIMPDPEALNPEPTQIEFCTGAGGGQSPRTLKALYALKQAMEADNNERLQHRG
jgi:hypothetical protein